MSFLQQQQIIYKPLVLLILLVFVNESAQDPIKYCTTNVCQNDGKCLLMSPTPLFAKCSPDEVYFDDKCYRIVRETFNWTQAEGYCSTHSGGLVTISSENQRNFVSSILKENVKNHSQAYSSIGFWTAGKSVKDAGAPPLMSSVKWYWQNATSPMKVYFWEFDQPKCSDDLNNICISLNTRSLFSSWSGQSCDDLNFFVCERTVSDIGVENWMTQCSCPTGFKGQYCDIRAEPRPNTVDLETVTNELCDDESLTLTCQNGGVILVDYLLYGHEKGDSVEKCRTNSTTAALLPSDDYDCIDPASLQTMILKCQGLNFCDIQKVGDLFPQKPCPGNIPSTLRYRIRCSNSTDIPNQCPYDSVYIQGRCYSAVLLDDAENMKTFAGAKADCGISKGDIAWPPENQISIIFSEITRKAVSLNVSLEGEKFWIKNELANFTGNGDCLYLTVEDDSPKAAPCEDKMNWICEFPPTNDQILRKTQYIGPIVTTTTAATTTLLQTTMGRNDSTVDASTKSGLKCPEITWLGIKFPETDACTDAVVPCPDPEEITGTVSFTCGCEHGTWMNTADLSKCTHKWVGEVKSSIEKRENSVNIVEKMVNNLRTNVAEQNLYGGDVTGVVGASASLLPLVHSQILDLTTTEHKKYFTYNFTSMFGESGNQLMSDNAVEAWHQLRTSDRIDKASSLMLFLEQSLVLLADHMPDSHLSFTNWASRVEARSQPSQQQTFSNPVQADPMKVSSRLMISNDQTQAKAFTRPFRTYGPSTVIEFDSFDEAPVMQIPNFDVLSASADSSAASSSQQNVMSNPMKATSRINSFSAPAEPELTKLGYFMYNSIGPLLISNQSSIINSRVMGAFVNDPARSVRLPASAPVNFTFFHLKTSGVENPRCVYWDAAGMDWSENGCVLLETTIKYSKCQCNHLTSFAILMDINANLDMLVGANQMALDLITKVGCSLSIVCLTASVVIFTAFRSLYNVRHAIHANLCFCLLVAELLFVLGIDKPQHFSACRGVAIALHYFFLAAFSWMLLEGYQLYMMLIQVFEPNRSRIYLYYMIGYGMPAVIVAISAGITWENYGTLTYCWINVRTSTLWAFVIPIIVIIASNIIVLLIALRVVLSVKSRDRTTAQRILGWLKGSAMLLCLLGITWIFGFLTAIPSASIAFGYIFCVLNSLQGVLIFVLHVMFNDKVRVVLVRAMRNGAFCCSVDQKGHSSGINYSSSKTGTTFFSKSRLLRFFRSEPYNPSQHSTESSIAKQGSPQFYSKNLKLAEIKLPPEEDMKIQTWHSKVLVQELEELTDRPSIVITPDVLKIPLTKGRGSSMPSQPAAPQRQKADLLRVQTNSLENRHSAPVKRKKFPLGSTEEQRAAELRGTQAQTSPPIADIIIEKL